MPRFVEVARQTFLLQWRSKVFLVLTGLTMLYAGIFLLPLFDASRNDGAELFELNSFRPMFLALLPFMTLYLAAEAVGSDLEDRTSVYLFTRPLSRLTLLVGKWLAVILLAGVFVTIAMTSMYAVFAFGPHEWRDASVPTATNYLTLLAGAWLAVVGYAAVGCLFAAWFRRPLLIAVMYVFLEQAASRLPPQVGIHVLTVAFPVRVFLFRHLVEPCRDLRDDLEIVGRGNAAAAGELLMGIDPYLTLLKIVLFTMILAAFIYSRKEYDSRPRE